MKLEKSDLENLMEQQKWSELREFIAAWQAPEIADLLSRLEKPDRLRLFLLLPRILGGEVFSHLDPEFQESILLELTDEENRQLLENLQPDDRTHLLERLPGEAVQKLLNLLSPAKSQEARQLLGYPEESVGRLMTTLYIAVRSGWTLDRALAHIRARGRAGDSMQTIYVVDGRWHLVDALDLQRFVLGDPGDIVEQIMDNTFVSLSPYDDREKAVEQIRRYDAVALPVVDEDGVLLGVVTVDDVMDVAEEEVTEDFQIGAGVSPLRTSYRDASAWQLYSKRMPWLLALIVIYLFASGIVGAYEETLSAQIVLASFIPMLMGSGGNVGGQSGTLTVRSLATGELED
ncbi:MAG: magnesium transporter, partial [Bryobacteraceae bacterium]